MAAALTVVDTYLCVNYNGFEFAFILKHPSLTKAGVKELKCISFRTESACSLGLKVLIIMVNT